MTSSLLTASALENSSHSTANWGTHSAHGWRALWLRFLHRLPTGKVWRRISLYLRKPLKSSLGDIVDVNIWNLRLRLRPRGNLSEQRLVLMPQHVDRIEREILATELKTGDVFFDIGANIGIYSYWVASRFGRDVRIEAFEPDPKLQARLGVNIANNPVALANLRVNPVALGSSEGEVVLVAGDGNAGENRIEAGSAQGTRVAMTTLPAFLVREKITRIDALKIDVEGHEIAVLEPLFKEVSRSVWPKLIICELTQDLDHGLAALLTSNGYVLSARGRLNGIYRLHRST